MKKTIIFGLFVITILVLSGCSEPQLFGKAKMEFDEGYKGNFRLKVDSNSLDDLSSLFMLPSDNPKTISSIVRFYSCKDMPCYAKIEVCNQGDQFGSVDIKCDIAKFRIIKEKDNAIFIREDCSECKKELGIIKGIVWQTQ
jgi:hypothetical protein